jgi:predicted anti-sigma-YlaC factor YlaD
MDVAEGQLCARARFWVSLRVDGECSELEDALLDAHLGGCADCRAFVAAALASTAAVRAASALRDPSPAHDAPRAAASIVRGRSRSATPLDQRRRSREAPPEPA